MKYCLSARQPDTILKKADEIKIDMRDFRAIPEFLEKYPNKTLILEMKNDIPEDFSWDMIKTYSEISDFYCAASNIDQIQECKFRGIKFYYKFAINSFYELKALKDLGASYILITSPLIFNLEKVKEYEIPIRVTPNLAYEPYLPHADGIIGGWIRPEDIKIYGKYIDTFEFYAEELKKESALYHIYAENGYWHGNLNLLIDNLNCDFNNDILFDADNFAKRRISCDQKCTKGSLCHYCYEQLDEKYIRLYLDYKKKFDL